MNSFLVKETVKSLYRMNAIAKDKSRKYIPINDEYTKLEAIEILLRELIRRMGFFDISIYRNIAGIYSDVEYNLCVAKLMKEPGMWIDNIDFESGKVSDFLVSIPVISDSFSSVSMPFSM